jgi:hypothetical protein
MTAIAALAMATVARPEGAVPPALEPVVRAACAGAWRAIEVVFAADTLRARLGRTTDTRVREGVEAVLGILDTERASRTDALTELRAARRAGELDGALDMTALAASCARAGDTTVVAAGRRRVRAQAIEKLKGELAGRRALATAVGESAISALLVDAARALFRHAVRGDKDLARWAVAPTGTGTRDRALTTFAELAASPASVEELDRLMTAPVQLDENVQFTIYRPRAIEPRVWHPLLAFAHLAERRPDETEGPDPVEEVRKQAEAVLGERAKDYQPIVQDSGSAIPAEGELTFVPEIAGVEFNPPRRSFLWLEPVHREDFRMRAGAELDGKTARGRMTVFLGHIAIAEIALSVRVDAARPEPVQEVAKARTYRKIFASYSHRDVAIVNQFEQYARALGDEYLRDWIHLRTGEVWNDRLRQLIEQSDAFQLFWSWNAMGSKFVQLEYEHALSLNRPSFVRPTYWEEPMPTAPGMPPEALLRLHFQKIGGAATSVVGAGSRAAAPVAMEREHEPEASLEESIAEPAPAAAPRRISAPPAAARRSEPEVDVASKRAKARVVAQRDLADDEVVERKHAAPVEEAKQAEALPRPAPPPAAVAAPLSPPAPAPAPAKLEAIAPAPAKLGATPIAPTPAPAELEAAPIAPAPAKLEAAPPEPPVPVLPPKPDVAASPVLAQADMAVAASRPEAKADVPSAKVEASSPSRTWIVVVVLLIIAVVVIYLTW